MSHSLSLSLPLPFPLCGGIALSLSTSFSLTRLRALHSQSFGGMKKKMKLLFLFFSEFINNTSHSILIHIYFQEDIKNNLVYFPPTSFSFSLTLFLSVDYLCLLRSLHCPPSLPLREEVLFLMRFQILLGAADVHEHLINTRDVLDVDLGREKS